MVNDGSGKATAEKRDGRACMGLRAVGGGRWNARKGQAAQAVRRRWQAHLAGPRSPLLNPRGLHNDGALAEQREDLAVRSTLWETLPFGLHLTGCLNCLCDPLVVPQRAWFLYCRACSSSSSTEYRYW